MTLKEQYYREDFHCFRHYIITCDKFLSKDENIIRLVSLETLWNENYFSVTSQFSPSENKYKDVPIFYEVPNIDLTKFYHSESKVLYNRNEYYCHPKFNKKDFGKIKKSKVPPNKFHYKRLNRNWIVENLSEEKILKTLTGEKIPYRLATITIKKEDSHFKKK